MTVTIPAGPLGKTGEYGRGTLSPVHQDMLEKQIIELVRDEGPMSVRYIFYRCISGMLPVTLAKNNTEYERISSLLTKLRDNGSVNPRMISDGTREFDHTAAGSDTFPSPWSEADTIPLLVCESGSLEGILSSVAHEYSVGLTALRGQASYTLKYEMREFSNTSDKPVTIFYVGDYDKAGYDIPGELEEFVGCEFVRLAVAPETIEKFGLSQVIPKKPTKEFPTTTEGEALTKEQLAGLVREALDKLLPEGALERCAEAWKKIRARDARLLEWGILVEKAIENGDTSLVLRDEDGELLPEFEI